MQIFGFLWMGIMVVQPLYAQPQRYLAELDQAYIHVIELEYEKAIEITQPLLDELKLSSIEEIALAHTILGASFCERKNYNQALEHFEALRVFAPDTTLDPLNPSPACQTLFETLQIKEAKNFKHDLAPVKKEKGIKPIENELAPKPHPTETKTIQEIQPAHAQLTLEGSQASRYIPFGVGQFKNQQKKSGVLFLVGQTLLYSAGITALSVHAADENKDLRDLGYVSLASGAFVSLWGIVDAVKKYKENE